MHFYPNPSKPKSWISVNLLTQQTLLHETQLNRHCNCVKKGLTCQQRKRDYTGIIDKMYTNNSLKSSIKQHSSQQTNRSPCIIPHLSTFSRVTESTALAIQNRKEAKLSSVGRRNFGFHLVLIFFTGYFSALHKNNIILLSYYQIKEELCSKTLWTGWKIYSS